jgi:hypothetical protein
VAESAAAHTDRPAHAASPQGVEFAPDSPLEEDGFELVVPDFRETFLLYRFRAANWPGPTAGLMTNLVTPLVTR